MAPQPKRGRSPAEPPARSTQSTSASGTRSQRQPSSKSESLASSSQAQTPTVAATPKKTSAKAAPLSTATVAASLATPASAKPSAKQQPNASSTAISHILTSRDVCPEVIGVTHAAFSDSGMTLATARTNGSLALYNVVLPHDSSTVGNKSLPPSSRHVDLVPIVATGGRKALHFTGLIWLYGKRSGDLEYIAASTLGGQVVIHSVQHNLAPVGLVARSGGAIRAMVKTGKRTFAAACADGCVRVYYIAESFQTAVVAPVAAAGPVTNVTDPTLPMSVTGVLLRILPKSVDCERTLCIAACPRLDLLTIGDDAAVITGWSLSDCVRKDTTTLAALVDEDDNDGGVASGGGLVGRRAAIFSSRLPEQALPLSITLVSVTATIAVGTSINEVHFLSAVDGSPVQSFMHHKGPVSQVASFGSAVFATGWHDSLRSYDVPATVGKRRPQLSSAATMTMTMRGGDVDGPMDDSQPPQLSSDLFVAGTAAGAYLPGDARRRTHFHEATSLAVAETTGVLMSASRDGTIMLSRAHIDSKASYVDSFGGRLDAPVFCSTATHTDSLGSRRADSDSSSVVVAVTRAASLEMFLTASQRPLQAPVDATSKDDRLSTAIVNEPLLRPMVECNVRGDFYLRGAWLETVGGDMGAASKRPLLVCAYATDERLLIATLWKSSREPAVAAASGTSFFSLSDTRPEQLTMRRHGSVALPMVSSVAWYTTPRGSFAFAASGRQLFQVWLDHDGLVEEIPLMDVATSTLPRGAATPVPFAVASDGSSSDVYFFPSAILQVLIVEAHHVALHNPREGKDSQQHASSAASAVSSAACLVITCHDTLHFVRLHTSISAADHQASVGSVRQPISTSVIQARMVSVCHAVSFDSSSNVNGQPNPVEAKVTSAAVASSDFASVSADQKQLYDRPTVTFFCPADGQHYVAYPPFHIQLDSTTAGNVLRLPVKAPKPIHSQLSASSRIFARVLRATPTALDVTHPLYICSHAGGVVVFRPQQAIQFLMQSQLEASRKDVRRRSLFACVAPFTIAERRRAVTGTTPGARGQRRGGARGVDDELRHVLHGEEEAAGEVENDSSLSNGPPVRRTTILVLDRNVDAMLEQLPLMWKVRRFAN